MLHLLIQYHTCGNPSKSYTLIRLIFSKENVIHYVNFQPKLRISSMCKQSLASPIASAAHLHTICPGGRCGMRRRSQITLNEPYNRTAYIRTSSVPLRNSIYRVCTGFCYLSIIRHGGEGIIIRRTAALRIQSYGMLLLKQGYKIEPTVSKAYTIIRSTRTVRRTVPGACNIENGKIPLYYKKQYKSVTASKMYKKQYKSSGVRVPVP